MTPDEEIEALELEQELRRRRGGEAKPAAEPEGFFTRKSKEVGEARKSGAEGEKDFLRGGSQGFSLGFADELAGVAGAAGDMFGKARDAVTGFGGGDEGVIEGAKRAYTEARDAERKNVADARERSPVASTVGQVAGGLLVPGGAASKMATMPGKMAVGGLVGAGTAAAAQAGEVDTMAEVPDAVASWPTVIGGAVGALAPGAGPAMSLLKKKGGDALARVGSRADELRVLTPSSAQSATIAGPAILREANNVPGGVPALAETLRKTGISKGITTSTGIAKRAAEVESKSGAAIGKFIDDATDAGGFVDVNALTARLRAKAAEAVGGGKGISEVAAKEAEALGSMADRFAELFPGGVAKPDAMKQASIALADDAAGAFAARAADRTIAGRGRALIEGRRATEAGISDTIDELGMPGGYQDAKTSFQAARLARESAESALGRADKRNFLSLTDAPLVAAGPVGQAAALTRKVVGPVMASAKATGAEMARALSERLAANPGASANLGPAMARLAGAATRGAAAVEAEHEALLMDDPEYAALVEEQAKRQSLIRKKPEAESLLRSRVDPSSAP